MKIHVLKLKLRKLHKYLGFTFSFFILYLTITGLLLTYPQTFNIDKIHVGNQFILKKYNMEGYEDVYQLNNDKNEIILIKKSIYINNNFLDSTEENILSLVYIDKNKLFYVVTEFNIYIYELEKKAGNLEILNTYSIENSKNIIKTGKDILSGQIIFGSESINYILKENNILKKRDINKSIDISWFNINLAKKKNIKKIFKNSSRRGCSDAKNNYGTS